MNGLTTTSNFSLTIANHLARKSGDMVQQRINALKIGDKMQDLPEELWHKSFKFYVKEDPNRKGGPNLRIIRLDPNKPAPTVTGYIFNKFVHPYEDRFITVREAARLQGFPDDITFYGTLTDTQMQVGNAVPIEFSQAIFNSLLSSSQKVLSKLKLSALSLFSGAGGMDIGAKLASIDTKLAIDFSQSACDTLQNYYDCHPKVIKRDITQVIDPLQFWHENTGETQSPDIVFGGPPCQAFSQAGKQKLDDRSNLIFEFLRFVEILQPSFFVIENVSNLRSVGGGYFFQKIVTKIAELKYNVTQGILSAASYGTPQLRKRLILMGCRKELGNLVLPAPTHYPEFGLFSNPYRSVVEAFEGLPPAQSISLL